MYHYCLIRADLPLGNLTAQLIHAAGESAALLSAPLPENTHAVALYAPDEASLHDLSARLTFENIPHKLICEPDAPFNGSAVALGICPQPRARLRKLLGKYQLIRNQKEENNGND